MKASEYYDNYAPKLMAAKTEEEETAVLRELAESMLSEQKQVMIARNIKTDHACQKLIDEFNTKWNVIVQKFKDEFGISPICKNGWYMLMDNLLAAVDNNLKENK